MVEAPFLQGFLMLGKNIKGIIDGVEGEAVKALKEDVSVVISPLL